METVLIAAISLDGFIARHEETGVGFTSRADQDWFGGIRRTFDCSVMGRKTYESSRAAILREVETEPEERLRVVLTRRPGDFQKARIAGRLEFSDAAPSTLLKEFQERGKSRCAVLGGGSVYRRFLEEGCADWLWLTLEPCLFGEGTPLIEGRLDSAFHLESTQHIGRHTLLLKYRPKS